MHGNMKLRIFAVSIFFVLLFAGIARSNDNDANAIGAEQIPDLLSTLASMTKDNFEKIKTWEGEITAESVLTIRGEKAPYLLEKYTNADQTESVKEIQQVVPRTIYFKMDMENNRFCSHSDYTVLRSYFVPANDMLYAASKWRLPENNTQIVTKDYQLTIGPLRWSNEREVTRRRAVKKEPRPVDRINPKDAFFIGSKSLWVSLSQLSQLLLMDDVETYRIIVRKKTVYGSLIYRVEVAEPGKEHPFSAIELDERVGFNRTLIENWHDNGALMSQTTTQFICLQGIYLPKEWTMSQYFPDGGLLRQETCTIEHQQINTTISEETFSELNYLQDGDTLRDEIQDKQYTVQEGKLIEKTEVKR